MALEKVEDLAISEYRTRLFMVFNMSALDAGMGGFKFKTEDEEMEEFDSQIAHYRKMGVFG